MNYGELKTKLIRLINRTDFTPEEAAEFLGQAQVRIERVLRTTAMEKMVYFTATDGAFRLPTDFLEIADIWTGETEMERVDHSTFIRTTNTAGTPKVFVQTGHDIRMKPMPSNDTEIFMRYYAAQPVLVDDTNVNMWSASAVDALIYGAAIYAAEFFEDERLTLFNERYNNALAELQDQSAQEDFAGPMRIRPAYTYDCDW